MQIRNRSESDPICSDFGTKIFFSDWIGLIKLFRDLEMVTVEVMKPKAKSFLVNAWYRPPSSKAELFYDYENVLEKIDAENVEAICIGDCHI